MYILCGSEGCNLGAVKWSPDVVSRSAKLGEMEVWYGAIKKWVSGVQDRVEVQRCEDGAERNDETRQTYVSLSSGENFLLFWSRYKSLKYKQ